MFNRTMQGLKLTLAAGALMSSVMVTSHAIAQTAPGAPSLSAAARAAASIKWVDGMPKAGKSDMAAVSIVTALRPDLTKYMARQKQKLIIYAYPIKFGGDQATYIIAAPGNLNFCGSNGCEVYVYRQTSATKNTWVEVLNENFNTLTIPSDPSKLTLPTVHAIDNPKGYEREWIFNGTKFMPRLLGPAPANPSSQPGVRR